MAERKLVEQWVEELDGKKHLVKAVKSDNERVSCSRCMFSDCHFTCVYPEDDCPVRNGHYIKDLGILNEDGLLPCPFCGEYPTLKEELDENDERIYAVEHECNIDMTTGWDHDKQTVIVAWNRRA